MTIHEENKRLSAAKKLYPLGAKVHWASKYNSKGFVGIGTVISYTYNDIPFTLEVQVRTEFDIKRYVIADIEDSAYPFHQKRLKLV